MHQQEQIRMQLASTLRAVVSQRLAKRKDGKGFVPAVEILINNPRVRELIEKRETNVHLHTIIEEGSIGWGMQSFDQSLMELVMKGFVSFDEALSLSTSPEDFRIRYSGVSQDGREWQESSDHRHRVQDAKISKTRKVRVVQPRIAQKKWFHA